jgi:hypothetical protein
MQVLVGPASTPCATIIAAVLVGPETASQNQVFQPGIPVPAGDAIGLDGANEAGPIAFYGYLVPASAVPANALSNLPSAIGRTSVLPAPPKE